LGGQVPGEAAEPGKEEKMNNRTAQLFRYPLFARLFLFLAICHLPFAISGCGYTTRSMISNQYKTIYVIPFLNKIDITSEANAGRDYRLYRPVLETDITRAVIDRFMFDGNLRPAKKENTDLILKGDLIDYRRDVLRYETDDTPEEYRISLAVDISLWDGKENKLIWEEKGFTGDTTYFLTGANAKSENAAITDATADLARRIVERTVENW
jgi:hypothetical protein